VTIANPSGTLTPAITSWSPSEIIVALAPSGAGAYGLVTATGAGIASNAVPLTEWNGQITYAASGPLSSWAGDSGSGSFALQSVFNVSLRADVHPTVVTMDASPEPQNLYFANAAPSSNGALTSGSGSFTSDNSSGNSCQGCSITLALASPQPTMIPLPTATNAFFVIPEAGATPPAGVSVPSPAPGCNSGQTGPGPGGTSPYTLCAFLYFTVSNPVTCAGNASYCSIVNGPLADELALSPGTDYLAPSITLDYDPVFYKLTLSAPQLQLDLDPFGNPGSGTASITGTFTVQSPPSLTGVSARHRI
jgi:hypothetical protein